MLCILAEVWSGGAGSEREENEEKEREEGRHRTVFSSCSCIMLVMAGVVFYRRVKFENGLQVGA